MAEKKGREAVIQNLKDAGCQEGFVERFLTCYDREEGEEQLKLLESWREELLNQVH